jgi:O-antigen/teichoic acid export membrane protein
VIGTQKQELASSLELVAGTGVTAIFTFAYILAAGRILGPADYADFSAAMSMFYFIAVALSPLTPTTSRIAALYVARGQSERIAPLETALRRHILRAFGFAAIPAAIAIVPLAHAFHFASPATLALSLGAAVVFTLVSIRRGVLQGIGRLREQMLNALGEAAVRLLLSVVFLLWWRTPTAALAAYLIAVLLAEWWMRRRFAGAAQDESIDWSGVRQLAMPMLIAMIGVATFQNADVLAVKRWFGSIDAGQYGAASTLARSISVLFVPVYQIAGPLLTHAHERGERLTRPTLRLCLFFLALAAIPAAIFAFAGQRLMLILYGSTFAGAGPLLVRLSCVAILTYLALLLAQALITAADPRFVFLYIGFAIAQIVAIFVSRHSIPAIIGALYVVQGALVIAMFLAMMTMRTERPPC